MQHGPDSGISLGYVTLVELDAHLNEVIARTERAQMIDCKWMSELMPLTGHRAISSFKMLSPGHQHVIGYLPPRAAIATLAAVCAPDRHTPLDFGADQR